VVHRPVLRAAVVQRFLQARALDAERFGEAQAFVVRHDACPQDEVVHHLADLPGAGRAEMEDVRGERAEGRPAGFERRFVAGAVDEQLAGDGGGFAARERDVEKHEAALAQAFGQPAGIARCDRRAERDGQPLVSRLVNAIGSKDNGFDLVLKTHNDDHELARPRHLARRVEHRHAESARVAPRHLERVVAGDAIALGDEMARHRRAHASEAEDSDFADCSHRAVSAV